MIEPVEIIYYHSPRARFVLKTRPRVRFKPGDEVYLDDLGDYVTDEWKHTGLMVGYAYEKISPTEVVVRLEPTWLEHGRFYKGE